MITQTKSQGVLFSEPSCSETAVWVELDEGIAPADWAHLCRYIGKMRPKEFAKMSRKIFGNPDGILSRFKRIFTFRQGEFEDFPLVSVGCEGMSIQTLIKE
ncbi:MAG: hypothetical protein A2Y10_15745 [Planctomycetes bacterium GWF2_41_51]|nr:MAG: hypothetical protein A2Y10_15745 [Planctomycetes bacterium GWF2_41_51]HBG27615.1 hypothetical protein [Phycisphaerales bacterium]